MVVKPWPWVEVMTAPPVSNIFRLDNRVVVITGGAGLLGRQHAEAIAAFGGTPVLLDNDLTRLEEAVSELSEILETNIHSKVVDITSEEEVRDCAEELVDEFGQIDGLINNAANNPKIETNSKTNFTRLENFPFEIWENDLAVGISGAYLCAKYFGTRMKDNPNGGVILNISSDLGLIAPDQRLYEDREYPKNEQPVKPVTYSVVKTALIGLTRYLATYWCEYGIRCNVLCPGGVENGQSPGFLADVSSRIPMGRLARPDEYHGVIVWMLSDASSYLNGAVIPVDGGRTAW